MPPNPADAAQTGRGAKARRLKTSITSDDPHPAFCSMVAAGSPELAEDLTQVLLSRNPEPAAVVTLHASVRKHVHNVHEHQIQFRHSHAPGFYGDRGLDQLGTNLWNRCTHVRREAAHKDSPAPQQALLLSARVFSFQIMHLVQWQDDCTPGALAYLMRLSLKAARSCIEEHDFELAQIVAQQLAEYENRADKLSKGKLESGEAEECTRLRAEYFGVRIALCWKENRLEVAEHMYAQMESLLPCLDPRSAENLAEVLFEIGRDLAGAKRDFAMASKWLGRSNDIVTGQSIGQLSPEGVSLRLSIFQAHITALLGLGSPAGFEKARSLVGYIEAEIGSQPFVLILNLELLSNSPAEAFDGEAYADVLRRMIKVFKHSDPNFKALKKHVQKLHDKSPGLGIKVLDEFLTSLQETGFEHGNGAEWYDKLVVLRVRMTTQHRESIDGIVQARAFFSSLQVPVGSKAATGSQMLIWKMLDASYSQGHFTLAMEWCHLALATVFQDSGPTNRAKIERKLLLCSISLNDMPVALSTYHGMADKTQNDEMTRYLMFKVAARSGDLELAAQCLETIGASEKGEDFLYACVLDAQKAGDNACVVEALKRLVQAHEYRPGGPIHLPTLLRCTIRYLHKLLGDKERQVNTEVVISDISTMFTQAAKGIHRNETDANGSKLFSLGELEWFCQNAYNLAIQSAQDWDPRYTVQVLDACIVIAKHFPSDATSPVAGDLPLRTLFCHFVNASALTALARGHDGLEERLLHYKGVRENVTGFETALDRYQESIGVSPADYRHLLKKLQTIIIFDLEAAIHLRQFEQLGEVTRRAIVCENADTFKALADCILRLQAPCEIPAQAFYSTLSLIVNQLSELQDYDSTSLARYTRCLFQATMGLDPELAFGELKATCSLVKRLIESMSTWQVERSPWPREELEWMATVAYNHGLDCSGQGDRDRAKRWIQMAMSLAHYNDDQGSLERLMHDNFMALTKSRQSTRDT